MSEPVTPAEPACWTWPYERPSGEGNRFERRDQVAAWQDGRCAICGVRPLDLEEDHDYYTGMTRGWLCGSCNSLEGCNEGPLIQSYRRKNPASMWLWRWEYANPWSSGLNPDAIHALTSGKLSKEQIQAGERLPVGVWQTARALNLGL